MAKKTEVVTEKGGGGRYGERTMWKVVIDAPVDVVWSTLVKTGEILPFFFGSVCDAGPGLAKGRAMRMVSPDRKNAIVVGEVTEFSPPHRYAHTIYFTQVEGEQPALTTYDLKELPGGKTEFTLTAEAVPGSKVGKMVQAGTMIVTTLKAVVETGKPDFTASMIMALNPLMGLMTPKISRIQNWPLDVAAWKLKEVK